jgi:hypothetical protein
LPPTVEKSQSAFIPGLSAPVVSCVLRRLCGNWREQTETDYFSGDTRIGNLR